MLTKSAHSKALSPELERLYQELTVTTSRDITQFSTLKELYGCDQSGWQSIIHTFQSDFRLFDMMLHRLHYLRTKQISEENRQKIITFLAIGYLNSDDIRYFNELLYFAHENDTTYRLLGERHFAKIILSSGHHPHPLATSDNVNGFCERMSAISTEVNKNRLRVGMLGSPKTFHSLYRNLRHDGYMPFCYYFSHERSPLKKLIKKCHLFQKLFFYLKGITTPFVTISDDINSDMITTRLMTDRLDIGTHCLGFIIKQNIIRCFSKGLLNDHLAPLPYVRGKSSVAYTLLFGFPLSATVHYIDESVDNGPLIKIFEYVNRFTSIEQANAFFSHSATVFPGTTPLPNDANQGLQYYTIHPDLRDYINNHLLTN